MLEILSAIAIAVGGSMMINDLAVDKAQAEEVAPVVQVAPVQPVEQTKEKGELGW